MSNLDRPTGDARIDDQFSAFPKSPELNEHGFLADHSRNNLLQLFGSDAVDLKNAAHFLEPEKVK